MFEVVEVNSLERLKSFRLRWDELFTKTRGVSYFQSFDWLQVWSQSIRPDARLRVLVISLRGRPLGILPLAVRVEPTEMGPMRVIGYPVDQQSAFYAPIGSNPAATLAAGMRHLKSTRRDWDLIDLRNIDRFGIDRQRTRNAFRTANLNVSDHKWFTHPVVVLTDTEDAAETRAASNAEYQSAEHRLGRFGNLRHIRVRPNGAFDGQTDREWEFFEQIMRLRETGFVFRKQGNAVAWLRELHSGAIDAGQVDMNVLYLNGRPIAGCYGYQNAGALEVVRFGTDPAKADDAARVLLGRMIEDGIERGDELYRLTNVPLQAQSLWQTGLQISSRHVHYPWLSLRAQCLRWRRQARRLRGSDSTLLPKTPPTELPIPVHAPRRREPIPHTTVSSGTDAESGKPTFRIVG